MYYGKFYGLSIVLYQIEIKFCWPINQYILKLMRHPAAYSILIFLCNNLIYRIYNSYAALMLSQLYGHFALCRRKHRAAWYPCQPCSAKDFRGWQWLVLAKKFLAITREPIQLSYLGKARLAFANKARQSLPENQVLLIDMYEQLHSSHQAYIQYQLKYKLDIQLITTKHI